MKKAPKHSSSKSEMRSEYDFTGGLRGKHQDAWQEGHTIRIRKADGTIVEEHRPEWNAVNLAPDVREYFPDSQSVNHALRTLISLVPDKRKAAKKRRSAKNGLTAITKSRAKKLR